jgi:hypothetical protein
MNKNKQLIPPKNVDKTKLYAYLSICVFKAFKHVYFGNPSVIFTLKKNKLGWHIPEHLYLS